MMNEASKRAPLMTALESLIEASNAVKNYRAILLLGLTFVTAALVTALFGVLVRSFESALIGGIGALLGFLVVFYGTNAVGILLMRDVQGQASHSMMDAVLVSLCTSHRIIAVLVLELLLIFAAFILVAVILFICKIPFLGPVLFTVVFPVAALFLGILIFSLLYVMLPLASPAVWSGSSVFQVIARLGMIIRTRLAAVILLEVVLFLIAGLTALLIFAVVVTGVMASAGLSASILGMNRIGMNGIGMPGLAMLMASVSGSGYTLAGGIGGGLLMAVAAVIPGLIFTKGICIIYIDSTRNLDFSQSEANLNQGLASIKKKAEEARDRARTLTEQNKLTAPAPVAANLAPDAKPSSAPPLFCPNCHSSIAADDLFCGNCAHKLK